MNPSKKITKTCRSVGRMHCTLVAAEIRQCNEQTSAPTYALTPVDRLTGALVFFVLPTSTQRRSTRPIGACAMGGDRRRAADLKIAFAREPIRGARGIGRRRAGLSRAFNRCDRESARVVRREFTSDTAFADRHAWSSIASTRCSWAGRGGTAEAE